MSQKCPNCKTDRFLKEIQYGMPGDGFDFTKFHVGGCIPSNAKIHCSNCDWEDHEAESTASSEDLS